MVRRSTALAALVAASLLLGPSPARAQFYHSGPGGFFASSPYISPVYRNSYLYYQHGLHYNPVVNNPFGYGGSMTPGLFAAAPAAMNAPPSARPIIGLSGNASFMSPFGHGGLNSYSGYPSYLYPDFGYPMGYGAPGFVNTANVLDPLSGAFPGVPAAMAPGFSMSGLSTVPYTPGLYLNALVPVPPAPGSGGREVTNPKTATSSVLFSSSPASHIRPAVGPGGDGSSGPAERPGSGTGAKAPAKIQVRLPTEDAKVWFQGQPTTRKGKVREFESPALESGAAYTYQVRASWMSDGEEVTRTRTISVIPGRRATVDFTSK